MAKLEDVTNLADAVRFHSHSRGDSIIFDFEDRLTTFAQFDKHTNQIANGLAALGVKPGEHIAYIGKNSDIYFELLIGGMKAGVVMTPVNWRLAGPEVAFIIEDSKSAILFLGPEFVDQVRAIKDQIPSVRHIMTTEGGAPEWKDVPAWRDAQSSADPGRPIDAGEVAIQLYTSGTTGKPKGAMLSHTNLLSMVRSGNGEVPEWNKWDDQDVSLVAMPVFHIGGTGWGALGLYFGAKGVVAREFDPTKVLDFIQHSKVSKMFMVPAAMQFVVRQPRAKETDF
jgi:fatty-acyl-CoA synthase